MSVDDIGCRVVRRVVIRPPNWLGDAVLALPAMAAVRARHSRRAHLTIAAVPAVAALFREDTGAGTDRVLELPAGTQASVAALAGRAVRRSASCFRTRSDRPGMLRRAGIPERWGYRTAGRGLLLTRRSRAGPRADDATSGRLLPRLGPRPRHRTATTASAPRVRAQAAERRARRRAAARSTASRPTRRSSAGAGRRVRPGEAVAARSHGGSWPRAWSRERDVTCVIVGASHDRDAARAIESWLRDARAGRAPSVSSNLVGRTSLGALVGVVARVVGVRVERLGRHAPGRGARPAGRGDLRPDRRAGDAPARAITTSSPNPCSAGPACCATVPSITAA